ncbi:MAG: YgdI/YgdR family lipoprotein, partial [Leptospirales bacterium]|nr:YgdI/YgdR family lipoprotein [Leptospirales bacterium]
MKKIIILLMAVVFLLIGCASQQETATEETPPLDAKIIEWDGKTLPKLLSQADIDAIMKNYKKIEADFNKFGKDNPDAAGKPQKLKEVDVKKIVKAMRTTPDLPKYNALLRKNGMKSNEPLLAFLLLGQNYGFLQHPM